jgi:membrane-associated phospholipid phosphatase
MQTFKAMKPGFAGPMLLAVLLFVAGSAMGQSVPATEKTGGGQPLKRCTDLSGKFTEPCPVETKTEASKSSSRRFDFERTFPRSFVRNQVTFWTSPVRMRASDLNWALPLGGLTAILIASDTRIEDQLPKSQSTIDRGNSVANYGVLAAGGLVGGAYLFGKMRGNSHLSETGWMSGEAVATTLATTFVVKAVARRARPLDAQGNGFGQGGSSFPSEHSAAAWSIASVFAHEYPGFGTKVLAYGAASAMSASRVIGRKHFSSDVLIGSALGWWLGRQVFESHNLPAEERAKWGSFKRSKESEDKVSILGVGSPYVPLDSWVYPAFDRLAALGYVQTAFLGLRPWTRMECARLVEEARAAIGEENSDYASIGQRLAVEFARELKSNGDNFGAIVSVDRLYFRFTNIAGQTLRDGYHFGQTIYNDFGRPFGEGGNLVTGADASGALGPLSFYLRAEYQKAPAGQSYDQNQRAVITGADFVGAVPPATPFPSVSRGRIVEGYVAMNLKNFQISVGKQALWWGPVRGGSMLFSNNAEPIPMLRMNRVVAVRLPSVLRYLGPVRGEVFLGRLGGQREVFTALGTLASNPRMLISLKPDGSDQPWLQGQKISFRPTPNLEFSVSRTGIFGGPGSGLTARSLYRSVFSSNNTLPGAVGDPGDRRSGFEFYYRIPRLRNWLILYTDSVTEDEYSPLGYPRRSAMNPGIYLPQLPKLRQMELRLEGVYTNLPGLRDRGYFFANSKYPQGYTNYGNILASWVGRQGQGWQASTTYSFNPQTQISASYRALRVDPLLVGGGSTNDVRIGGDIDLGGGMTMSAWVQYERWRFPLLSPTPRNNVASSIQISYRPNWRLKR